MNETESVFGKGFYDYDKHRKFFTMQGQQGYEAAFFALELAEMMIVDPQWARAMSMRLKDCVDVLYKTVEPRGRKATYSLNKNMLMRIPLPSEYNLPNLDGVHMTDDLLFKIEGISQVEEIRKNQGKDVILAYYHLKEEFLLRYRELQIAGKASSQAYLIEQVVGLWSRTKHKDQMEFIKQHQQTFMSKLSG